MAACLPKNALLLDEARTMQPIGSAINHLGREVQGIEREDSFFIGHGAQFFALYLQQRDFGRAPLLHPFLLFLGRLGEA